jgi:hypothetical protein
MKATTHFNLMVNEWQFLTERLGDHCDLRVPGYTYEHDDTDYRAIQKSIWKTGQLPLPLDVIHLAVEYVYVYLHSKQIKQSSQGEEFSNPIPPDVLKAAVSLASKILYDYPIPVTDCSTSNDKLFQAELKLCTKLEIALHRPTRHSCGHVLMCMLEEASISKVQKFDQLKIDMSLFLDASLINVHLSYLFQVTTLAYASLQVACRANAIPLVLSHSMVNLCAVECRAAQQAVIQSLYDVSKTPSMCDSTACMVGSLLLRCIR